MATDSPPPRHWSERIGSPTTLLVGEPLKLGLDRLLAKADQLNESQPAHVAEPKPFRFSGTKESSNELQAVRWKPALSDGRG